MAKTTDFCIIGGGIAGASLGYHLSYHGSVCLLEMEPQPGYHTTGRSAAFFAESYGAAPIRYLTTASKNFLYNPPKGFSDVPLIQERGAVYIYDKRRVNKADAVFAEMAQNIPNMTRLSASQVLALAPHLAGSQVAGGLADFDCGDLDVAALHQGYLRGLKARGGVVQTNSKLISAQRRGGVWRATTNQGDIQAGVLINAAGAWADEVGVAAGAKAIGFKPLRRTIITIASDQAVGEGPVVIDLDERYYIKPERGHFIVSPCDESLSPACDAQPEDHDVAVAAAYFSKATGTTVTRIENKWAGLRTFAPDRAPVIGFDPVVEGLFWSAGHGGYGIQTAPAWAQSAASLLLKGVLPKGLTAVGATPELYSPARFINI